MAAATAPFAAGLALCGSTSSCTVPGQVMLRTAHLGSLSVPSTELVCSRAVQPVCSTPARARGSAFSGKSGCPADSSSAATFGLGASPFGLAFSISLPFQSLPDAPRLPAKAATGGGGSDGGDGGSGGGGGGGGGGEEGGDGADDDSSKNKAEALAALAALGRTLDSLPKDLAEVITSGKVPALIVERFGALEKSPLLAPLLRFAGFKERLLADDLFMTKVGIECGVGLFTKTAAEYQKRKENFFKELDFVIADVIMALVADFMLVWLPAPTVALSPRSTTQMNAVAAFFAACPDNAFQVALRGTSYTVLQRFGAIIRNGGKLLAVGTCASLLGTGMTNGLKSLRKVGQQPGEGAVAEAEPEVPILATSVAYGVYMAVSSNLRYQVLAGVVEQRMLEPMLEHNKLALSVLSFIARTSNTFLGSLLWVDYARWVGVQSHE